MTDPSIPDPQAGGDGVLRAHAKDQYAAELAALAAVDDRPRPPRWRLSPWAVTTYLLGPARVTVVIVATPASDPVSCRSPVGGVVTGSLKFSRNRTVPNGDPAVAPWAVSAVPFWIVSRISWSVTFSCQSGRVRSGARTIGPWGPSPRPR